MKFMALGFLFFIAPLVQAQIAPSDVSYKSYFSDNYNYIVSQSDQQNLKLIAPFNRWLKFEYEQSYNWALDEQTSLALASSRQQIKNAFATVLPNNLTLFYPGGIGDNAHFSMRSWVDALVVHETAHLYQLNVKDTLPAVFKKIFGNNMMPLPLPFFTLPNIFLPNAFLEGNAVFNESRFGLGGRLYTASIWAHTLALFKARAVNEDLFLNNHDRYPYGREKYSIGGLYFAYLAEQYGEVKTNQFFKEHAKRWINPLLINKSHLRQFGKSFTQLFNEFTEFYNKLSLHQKSIPNTLESVHSVHIPKLNKAHNKIVFISTDHRVYKRLHAYSLLKNQWSSRVTDLPVGRVFEFENKYVSQAQVQQDYKGLGTYSGLYKPGYHRLDKYFNQVNVDFHFLPPQMGPGSHPPAALTNVNLGPSKEPTAEALAPSKPRVLSFNLTHGFLNNHFYLDDKAYDSSFGEPMFGPQGHIYYFQRKGQSTLLLKNKAVLAIYKGYSFELQDIAPNGDIFFTAPTPYGSSLYKYNLKSDKTHRLFTADTVVGAKHIQDQRFVITQATGSGYTTFVASADLNELSQPFNKRFSFDNNEISNSTFKSIKINPDQLKPYNSIYQLRYSYLLASLSSYNNVFKALIGANFNDPLLTQSVSVSGFKTNVDTSGYSALYKNSLYRWGWSVRYTNDPQLDVTLDGQLIKAYNNTLFEVQTKYPWLRKGHWKGDFLLDYSWLEDEFFSDYENTYEASLNLSHSIKYRLAHLPKHYYFTSIKYREVNLRPVYTLHLTTTHDVYSQDYLTGQLSYAEADSSDIRISSTASSLTDFRLPSLGVPIKTTAAYKAQLKLTKPLPWDFYFNKIPFGIKKVVPFISETLLAYRKPNTKEYTQINEHLLGLELTLLLAHKFELTLETLSGRSSYDNKLNHQWWVGTQREF